MRDDEWTSWLACLGRLSAEQRLQLFQRLEAVTAGDDVEAALLRRRSQHPECPHCQGLHVVRNGHADGRQRYKCRDCGRSFNTLTGTPLARLRHRERWMEQAEVLASGLSVRKAALRLQVHRTTAFRWRHRVLCLPKSLKASGLQGVAEADETYQLRSFKGGPQLLAEQSRQARRHGGRAAKGAVRRASARPGAARPQRRDDRLRAARRQQGGGQAGAAAGLGRRHGAVHRWQRHAGGSRARTGVGAPGRQHLQRRATSGCLAYPEVNAYHSRFKTWMRRFNGVATLYLENYLGWFRALDRNAQAGAKPASLLDLALGV